MGVIKRIHINQHIIRSNRKNDTDEPCITVKIRGRTLRARSVEIEQGILEYHAKPLSCGAHVWVETKGPITIDGIVHN